MSPFLLLLIAALVALAVPRLLPERIAAPWMTTVSRILAAVLLIGAVLSTSIISISPNRVGLVRKVYGTRSLPEGRLIAANGETGYQADIIPPGTFRISPLFNLFNTIEERPIVVVPQGFYGRIVARDGLSLPEGQIIADAWPDAEFSKFLNAEYFLTHGGEKGLQLSVLKPGSYPLNLALFEVRVGYERNGNDVTRTTDDVYDINGLHTEETPLSTAITRVPAGFVGVVRSSVQSKSADCSAIIARTDPEGLTAELVPENCKGIWARSLPPNDYYINRNAYDVTLVSTRVTTLEFKGGYARRFIDIKVDGKGDFTQSERSININKPEESADTAVNTKVEGWEIPQELRAVVQITPENAPIVVAAVGGQDEVDKRIVIPSIRSHVRNVYGGLLTVTEPDASGVQRTVTRPTRAMDTIEQRPALEQAILTLARVDGRRAGVEVKEIRLGESAIPPELLLARQREQLAGQLKLAFIQEQSAQEQRQKTEQARATADQQRDLVAAQIAVQVARLEQDKRQAQGRAERLFLEEQAAGQTAQAEVLGKDSVLRLQQLKIVTELLATHPELLRNLNLPRVVVSGHGGGLEGAAAVLGSFWPENATTK